MMILWGCWPTAKELASWRKARVKGSNLFFMISRKPDLLVGVELIKPAGISIEPDLGYAGGEAP
jgi:hypothetical protein